MMGYILALDQGTTSTRALLFDGEGFPISISQKSLPQHYPNPGWVNHDPLDIATHAREVLRDAVRQAGIEPREIAALGIANQRETVVLWDRRTGAPVHPAIVWQSRQSEAICEALRAEGRSPMVLERTGLVLDPYFSGSKLRWIFEHSPHLLNEAAAGNLLAGTVDSWLVWSLSKERVHVTDASNASRTMLLDIRSGIWDPELCALFSVPPSILPTVVDSSGAVATLDESILGVPIPIAGIAGDQQAALFGQGCRIPGAAKNTYGTGCFLLMHAGNDPIPARNGLLTTVAWRRRGRLEYALEGSVFVAGAAVQWLRDSLGVIGDAAETEALAESLAGNDGVYLVPAFVGLGAPHWDSAARAAIVGMTRGAGKAHLARAALECMAYQSRDLIDLMTGTAGIPLAALRVDGGATANRFLMQFQADILGIPVEVAAVQETTARGAALLAGAGVGMWTDADIARICEGIGARYEPRLESGDRERLHAEWQLAVASARSFKP